MKNNRFMNPEDMNDSSSTDGRNYIVEGVDATVLPACKKCECGVTVKELIKRKEKRNMLVKWIEGKIVCPDCLEMKEG